MEDEIRYLQVELESALLDDKPRISNSVDQDECDDVKIARTKESLAAIRTVPIIFCVLFVLIF
jgi:hypothetical protein